MQIDERRPSDLDALLPIARRVHARDGYPPYLPDDDFEGFLVSDDAINAWVARTRGSVAGQVALHRSSSDAVMELACTELGLSRSHLAVVARLLVDPEQRRSGVARGLLDHAAGHALPLGLTPILDVVDRFAPAIALYESAGWRRLGTVNVQLPGGITLTEHVYTAPG